MDIFGLHTITWFGGSIFNYLQHLSPSVFLAIQVLQVLNQVGCLRSVKRISKLSQMFKIDMKMARYFKSPDHMFLRG